MGETNLIPKLRFPEFEGNWIEKKLGQVGNFMGGGTPDSSNEEYWNGNIPWISSSDIKENNIHEINITRFITKEAVNASATKIIPSNSVLIVSRVGIGKFSVAKQELCTSQDFTNLAPKNNDSYFLAYYFSARSNRFIRLSQGTSIKGFTGTDIRNMKFIIPEILIEQQKIASFLTAVDQRIQLLQKKKVKLEEYKKGLMQKLFSREIRFKDENRNDFPDWEEKRLGDLYSFKSTNSFSREKLNYETGFVKNIHYGDIHTKFSTSFNITKEKVPYINPDLDLDKIADENYAQEGDLVIADASENYADIGKTIELIILDGQKVLAGLHTFLARRKDDLLVIGFGGHLMKKPHMRKEIYRIAQGSKVLSISSNRLSEVLVKIPIAFEQQKIAGFLSSLDQKIEQVGAQIEKMQVWKKGLLQKMFV